MNSRSTHEGTLMMTLRVGEMILQTLVLALIRENATFQLKINENKEMVLPFSSASSYLVWSRSYVLELSII